MEPPGGSRQLFQTGSNRMPSGAITAAGFGILEISWQLTSLLNYLEYNV